jgi:hypothetical protein
MVGIVVLETALSFTAVMASAEETARDTEIDISIAS